MQQDAVLGPGGPTHDPGDAIVKAPSRETSDFGVAHWAEAALLMPKKAKKTRAPKRVPHMIPFAFLEVGFERGIVGICVASNLDMPAYGSVTGQQ
jgi:hypothetical protein